MYLCIHIYIYKYIYSYTYTLKHVKFHVHVCFIRMHMHTSAGQRWHLGRSPPPRAWSFRLASFTLGVPQIWGRHVQTFDTHCTCNSLVILYVALQTERGAQIKTNRILAFSFVPQYGIGHASQHRLLGPLHRACSAGLQSLWYLCQKPQKNISVSLTHGHSSHVGGSLIQCEWMWCTAAARYEQEDTLLSMTAAANHEVLWHDAGQRAKIPNQVC